uniref:Papilin a, proteoglycan-like sulfated glycoprotein n=1 Tax=Labrus bergylta TaxID=56723 RepID=A0A3Q3H211_9LABR
AWGPYGDCSRSCGSGCSCLTFDLSVASHWSSQDCPEGSRDFREEQCSQFDGTDFQGKRYKWLPYYGAENPCELNCMPRGENFFYRHRSAVVDGTPCHPGRKDVCVDGVCKRLGCDNMLESPQQEDPCLQCGGNGQSCHRVQNNTLCFNLSARAAIKNLRGEYYLNGHWVIEFSRATPIAGTVLYYQRGAEGDNVPETIIGRGPTTEPLVVELISQEPNQGVEYEFYLPNGRSREGYYWSFGSWSSCSKECGLGYQSRLVFCTIDNESYPDYLCASLPRPQTNRTCNPHPCPQVRSWRTGEWNTCSVTCGGGSQVRRVECVSQDASGPRVVEDATCAAYAEAPPTLQTCNMHKCAEYRATRWSACSVTCGSGQQTREISCIGSGGMRLEETSCSTLLRPTAVRPCEAAACPRQISWHVGEWGLCVRPLGCSSTRRSPVCSSTRMFVHSDVSSVFVHSEVFSVFVLSEVSSVFVHSEVSSVFVSIAIVYSELFLVLCSLFVSNRKCSDALCEVGVCLCELLPRSVSAHRTETDPIQTNTVHDPHDSAPALHCSQSRYGCCPDGRTTAGGPRGLGCPRNAAQCRLTTYGCCFDRTTPAGGPNGESCPNPPNHSETKRLSHRVLSTLWLCHFLFLTLAYEKKFSSVWTPTFERSICSLPRAAGSCSAWTSRYHFDVLTSKCAHFWFGGCHGNSNNFMTRAECQRACPVPNPSQQGPGQIAPAVEQTPRRGSTAGRTPAAAGGGAGTRSGSATPSAGGGSRAGGSTSGGSAGGAGRQSSTAAEHAHRARVYLRPRRPLTATAAQHTGPAAR